MTIYRSFDRPLTAEEMHQCDTCEGTGLVEGRRCPNRHCMRGVVVTAERRSTAGAVQNMREKRGDE